MSTIGDNIKKYRIQNKMTQQQLAETCNLSKNAIWNYENNKRKPTAETLVNISKALNTYVTNLIVVENYKENDDTPISELTQNKLFIKKLETKEDALLKTFNNLLRASNKDTNEVILSALDILIEYTKFNSEFENLSNLRFNTTEKFTILQNTSTFLESELIKFVYRRSINGAEES